MKRPGNGSIVFTPARQKALKADWEAGLDAAVIAERLNKLPGIHPVAGAGAVRYKANALGLKRPDGWLRERKKNAVPVTWTAARLEVLQNLINLIPDADVLDKVNTLPGPPAKSISAMRDRAQRMGYLTARPRKSGQDQPTWTDERLAFLRDNYGRIRPAELLARLQAMSGAPITSIKTARSAAARYGIKSACIFRFKPPTPVRRAAKPRAIMVAPAPAPEPEPAPLSAEEQEAIVADRLAKREEQAMKLFSQGKNATSVSAALKIPLREAFRLAGLHRQQKQEAA